MGIGGGAVGARLAAMTGQYVGYEPDEDSRALASSRLPAQATVIADLDAVAGEKFAMVCAFEVIEHISDDKAALDDWVSRIAPGGHLVLSTPAFAAKMGPWDRRVGHHRRYDPDTMASMLSDAGLADVVVTAVGFPLGHLLEGVRNVIARVSGGREADSMDSRTAGSGRLYQPNRGAVFTEVATAPFRRLQRRFPDRGTGLVATGRTTA